VRVYVCVCSVCVLVYVCELSVRVHVRIMCEYVSYSVLQKHLPSSSLSRYEYVNMGVYMRIYVYMYVCIYAVYVYMYV
jgi:hypothetical protein